MTSNEGQNALKVEEVVIQKDEPEQEEEEVEEEKEQNEEQEQEPKDQQDQREQNDQENEVKDEDDNPNQIIHKKDDNEEEEENDGNPIREIQLGGNDEKANNFKLDLSPEIKINVGWELNDNNQVDVDFKTDSKKNLVLHWGVYINNQRDKWSHIDKSYYPPSTHEFDAFALETDFSDEQKINIKFPKDNVDCLNYVFKEKDTDIWYNNNGNDYHIELN
jgi:hypothetical protein